MADFSGVQRLNVMACVVASAAFAMATAAHGAGTSEGSESSEAVLSTTSLLLPATAGWQEAKPASDDKAASAGKPGAPITSHVAYAQAGWTGWTISLAAASDGENDTDLGAGVMLSTFVADRFELGGELGGWYFNQRNDTGGVSLVLVAKWHFWMSEDRVWSVFGEGRIGVLGSFDETPDGGTKFNFLPGVGVGATRAIDGTAARLMAGVRWHHISNARINGDDDNPGRDSLLGYVGITFAF